MLAANVCAATFLDEREQKLLYRVHAGPTPEKLDNLREFLRGFNLGMPGGDKPHSKDYARLMDAIKDRPDRSLLQTVLLRSMQQAVYSPDNEGHFGLAYPAYAHFTSPIRRYPDLLVHRAIKAVLAGERYEPGDWRSLGEHASLTERRADEASRDVVQWLKCFFMKDRVNEEFEGTISAVTGFGIFVQLVSLHVEGLVHISELGNDYFHFDQARHELRGERGLHAYRLSGKVRVRVAHVDLDLARIDFRLAD
jgi:ribonuclease R